MTGRYLLFAAVAAMLLLAAEPASAQTFSLDFGNGEEGGSVTGRIVQLMALMTVLSLAPSILVMVTSFTRIVVVLSFVRTAMGTQQTPPNQVLVSLALFLSWFVMEPVLDASWTNGLGPMVNEAMPVEEGFPLAIEPFRLFMADRIAPDTFDALATLRPDFQAGTEIVEAP